MRLCKLGRGGEQLAVGDWQLAVSNWPLATGRTTFQCPAAEGGGRGKQLSEGRPGARPSSRGSRCRAARIPHSTGGKSWWLWVS